MPRLISVGVSNITNRPELLTSITRHAQTGVDVDVILAGGIVQAVMGNTVINVCFTPVAFKAKFALTANETPK